MQPELLELIQMRMAASHNEQVWAVTLVGSMNGFVIAQVDRLIASIEYKKIRLGIWTATVLCILFIFQRHGIYLHYSNLIDQEFAVFKTLSPMLQLLRWGVLSSGVLLYSSIAAGISIAAHLTCKKAEQLKEESAKKMAQNVSVTVTQDG